MEGFLIRGCRVLHGSIRAGGAKNAALPMLAATALARDQFVFRRVPFIRDIKVMLEILSVLGANICWEHDAKSGERLLSVDTRLLHGAEIPDYLMRQMRSSIFLMGPLLASGGEARASYPGGCIIGPRPIDLHLKGLHRLGAEIAESGGYIEASTAGRLSGAEIHLDVPSVGATEHLMMAAALADGQTVIRNAAKDPEIVGLQQMLIGMGAAVEGAGSDTIIVTGKKQLHGGHFQVIPDRIEAGTLLMAAAITGGEVTVTGVVPEHLTAVLAKLQEAGADIDKDGDSIRLRQARRPVATNVRTQPYPGFPTDLQNPFLALMCSAEGTSVISENIWGNRFRVADEFRRMGAEIHIEDRIAVVRGKPHLTGADVQATDDLRGGAALILAALAARGQSRVFGAESVDRGYEQIDNKLSALGADIRRL